METAAWPALCDEAWKLFASGGFDKAYRVAAQALALAETAVGAHHADLVRPLHTLGEICIARSSLDEASAFLRRALDLCTDDDPNLGAVLLALAGVSDDLGEHASAIALYKRVIALYDRRPDANDARRQVAHAFNGLAIAYHHTGDDARTREALATALELFTSTFGSDHPETRAIRDNIAALTGH